MSEIKLALERANKYIKAESIALSEVAGLTHIPERTLYNWFGGHTTPNNSMLNSFIDRFERAYRVKL